MTTFDFHNKTFFLIKNSEDGKVDSDTKFEYQQKGDLVTADYYGGTIVYGKIIAKLAGNQLDMLYQCLTSDGELKAGKAIANISVTKQGKIKLELKWKWIGGKEGSGVSEYLEQ